jgi:broad specificity phosphatase PhoE
MRLAIELALLKTATEGHVSPLGRAKLTAAHIGQFVPLDFREEPRLAEVTLGNWDGLTHYEIDMEYPGMLAGADAFDWYFRSPNGESFDEVCGRVRTWLASLSCPTVAISQGLTGRLIKGLYLGLSRRKMLKLSGPQDGFSLLANHSLRHIE